MKVKPGQNSLRVVLSVGAALFMLPVFACLAQEGSSQQAPGQQAPAPPTESAAGNQVALSFDLNTCQQLGPGLYQCPGSDKPICDPGYNKGDVDCVKVDKNGVLIRQGF